MKTIRIHLLAAAAILACLPGCIVETQDSELDESLEMVDTEEESVDPSCPSNVIVGEGNPLATVGSCGKLVYRTYANRGQSNAVNRLPDFSYAGYRRGGVAIPTIAVKATVSSGAGDDRARIQAAIDKVSSLPVDADGFRGTVLLKKGQYELSDSLHINASGVVLRGEGQGKTGTVLVATAAKQYDLIKIQGEGSGFGEVAGTREKITSPFVAVGSRSFEVESASGYAVGDRISVVRKPNQAWIDALGMAPYDWNPSSYEVEHPRKITAINGNKITVDIPIVDTIENKYGGGYVYLSNVEGRIRYTGVEDIRLESKYASSTDEKHGWSAIQFARTTDSWVRRVTVAYFGYSAVLVADQSAFITVEDTAHIDPKSIITGGRRYAFHVSDGIGVLFQRVLARDSRHAFVTGSRVTGPNVWLDALSDDAHADDGPHHRWATGLLFDNTKGSELDVQNRKESGSGHGWAGAQVLFWNCSASSIIADAPKGAMNWAIGCTGAKSEGRWAPEEPFGIWHSHGNSVTPRSLYLQQLADRKGKAAVDAVTVPAQRAGRIWNKLNAWDGNGKLADLL